MRYPGPFVLEDFHAQYEHRSDLLNLATSDARYWTLSELRAICERVRAELDTFELSYPDIAALRELLEPFSRRVPDSSVIPTSGAGEAIFLALAALSSQLGGELSVAVPRPAFGAFEGVIELLGHRAEPYYYRPDAGWTLDTNQLLDCARRCDVVIVNSPHNPTGSVLDPELLRRVAEALQERGRYLICDEVFVLPDEEAFNRSLEASSIVIGSLSKVFGMPGLRLGWLITPREVGDRVMRLQQYTSLSLNAFTARLGAAVIADVAAFGRARHLERNRRIVQAWAERNQGRVRVGPCKGGTVTVLELETDGPEPRIFERLLARNVLLAPGRCFRVDAPRPWFRLGYGRETKSLESALSIVEAMLTEP